MAPDVRIRIRERYQAMLTCRAGDHPAMFWGISICYTQNIGYNPEIIPKIIGYYTQIFGYSEGRQGIYPKFINKEPFFGCNTQIFGYQTQIFGFLTHWANNKGGGGGTKTRAGNNIPNKKGYITHIFGINTHI
jgi:hypothetical protein